MAELLTIYYNGKVDCHLTYEDIKKQPIEFFLYNMKYKIAIKDEKIILLAISSYDCTTGDIIHKQLNINDYMWDAGNGICYQFNVKNCRDLNSR